jgi:protoporphyrinogen oxidase
MKDGELIDMAFEDVKKLELFGPGEVLDKFVTRVGQAYPIYDIGFDERVRYILKRLSDIPNLFSAGRNGLFLNSDIHDSIEIGLLAADTIQARTDSSHWYEQMDNYIAEKLEGTK